MSALHDLLTFESAAVLAAATAIGGLAVKTWPVITRVSRFLDDVQGEPERPGVPARSGWSERLAALETGQTAIVTRVTRLEGTAERIRAQTENSHATNLRDDLDAVAAKVDDLHHRHGHTRRKDTP